MSRRRPPTVLLAVLVAALATCALLVPQARVAPAVAGAPVTPAAGTTPLGATALRGTAAAAVLAEVHDAATPVRAGTDVLSATGRSGALTLVVAALAAGGLTASVPRSSAGVLDQLVLEPDGAGVLVVPAGTLAAPDAGAVPVRIAPAALSPLLSDTGRRLRDLARTEATPGGIVTSTAPGTAPARPGARPSPTTVAPTNSPSTPAAEPAPATPPGTAPDCATLRCVALTFDDGPGKYTAQLLDELAAARAPATFFLVGRNVAKYPDLVAREVADGHAVGNHSWDHHSLVTLPPDAVAAELDQTTAAIQAAAGVGTTLVRPPYGATNDQVAAALAARGDAAIMWSVDTEDWKNRDVALTTQRALAGAAPGSIILMHDIHPTTVQAVPGIIDQLRAAGYTLVTVPQLLGAITPGQTYRHG